MNSAFTAVKNVVMSEDGKKVLIGIAGVLASVFAQRAVQSALDHSSSTPELNEA
jgi:hypothetical protein